MAKVADDRTISPSMCHEVASIMDVVTFRMARLVAVQNRAGQHWTDRKFDLSLNEWWLLAVTHAHQFVRAGDIADMLAMDKSQLSRLIKSLVAQKLIKRTSDPVDARATMIHVTGKGHMVHDRLLKEVVRRSETELAPLSGEELRQLNDLLERLTDHNVGLLHKNC